MSLLPPNTSVHYSVVVREIVKRKSAKVYLEIGLETGDHFSQIEVEHAIGVDPAPILSKDVTIGKKSCSLFRTTSDEFFDSFKGPRVDVAFLDGMHLFEFLLRDFYNCEAVCAQNGIIALHDCLPTTVEMASRIGYGGAWTGDVWRLIPILRRYRPSLEITVLDCAPTGLVIVSNLDPSSQILREQYFDICRRTMVSRDEAADLIDFRSTLSVTKAEDFLGENRHSLYIRM